MPESASHFTTTIVLRKRKRTNESLVLRVSSSPSPSWHHSQSESEYDSTSGLDASSGRADNAAETSDPRNTPYKCTYEGCEKAYSKPSRLVEHQRSHTGDRPFACNVCQKTFLRESHLQAHARTHLPESAKSFICSEPGCGRRFWTNQHLRVHEKVHMGEKPFKCREPSCEASFAKHHQLRTHICSAHSLQGTKPYPCEHSGCTKSFTTNQKLRAHMQTHDEKRYTCSHNSCLPAAGRLPAYFPTWSSLQHHMRTVHPPTCPYASCQGKTFTAQKGLRAHLKIHAERDLEGQLNDTSADGTLFDDEHPRKRRRGGEIGRDWVCDETGCGKDFKSKKALTTHQAVTHLGRRDFVCPEPSCGRAFGYKHLLQRHAARVHRPNSPSSSDSEETPSSEDESSSTEPEDQPGLSIALITGREYATQSQVRLRSGKGLMCPYPTLPTSLLEQESDVLDTSALSNFSQNKCQYVFSRAYDFRRHMQVEHGLSIAKENVDRWVQLAKQAVVAVGSP